MLRTPSALVPFLLCALAAPAAAGAQSARLPETAALTALSEQVLDSLENAELAARHGLFDAEPYMDRVFEGLVVPPALRDGVRRGAAQRGLDLFMAFRDDPREASNVYMGTFRRDGVDVIRIRRIFGDDGGFDVLDWAVRPDPRGRARIVDLHAMATGTWTSAATREELRSLFAGNVAEVRDRTRFITEARALLLTGRAREALDRVRALPLAERRRRVVVLVWIAAAISAGTDAEYTEALETVVAAFPDDVAGLAHRVDLGILTRRWDESFKALDKLESEYGANAYFDVLRASVHVASGDVPGAIPRVRAATEREPTLDEAHFMAMEVYAAAGRHADVVRHIRALEGLEITFGDRLEEVPAFAAFVRSPEYAEWRRTRRPAP